VAITTNKLNATANKPVIHVFAEAVALNLITRD
jgi:hypothetical protein